MAGHADAHDHLPTHGHVTPLSVYLAVFAALMVLTVVTVLVAYVDLGQFNKVVALGIAGFKAVIVVLYFMHVKHASRLTKVIVVSGLFFLAILMALTMLDYGSRMWVSPPPPLVH